MEIVTGRTGSPHITSVQDRALNQGIAGKGVYILNTGQNLKTEIASNNEIHINDGALLFQGCEFAVAPSTYDTITVPNGTQGMQRKDLITVKYTYDGASQTESGEWGYVRGTPDANNPTVPLISSDGDLQKLEPEAEAAVFVVTLNGVNIISVEPVINLLNNLSDITAAGINSQLLWQGRYLMNESQTVTLPVSVESLKSGLILTFSPYDTLTGTVYEYGYQSFIVDKNWLNLHPGNGWSQTMFQDRFSKACTKYLQISNNAIKGDDRNQNRGTGACGITYDNTSMILRAVSGF